MTFVRAAFTLLFSAPLLGADVPALHDAGHGLRVPEQFRIDLYADHDLVPDAYAMTLDRAGRPVVSGKGYIKALHDRDGDGRADDAVVFAQPGGGGMGMLYQGNDLLFCGNGGFWRYRDADGDGRADGEPELIDKFGSGEHGIHAIRRGLDGAIYVIGGNDAGISAAHARDENSPVKEPEGGAILRYTPDLGSSAIIAHGFRNPYDFDFNADGEIFVYDSDCEREFPLPWYAPTRLYHAGFGCHHGWRLRGWQRGWKRPDYYFDSIKPVANIGRGSPTGVCVYRAWAFPERYRGGVFFCDWTFGKIYYCALTPDGNSYAGEPEVFLEPSGTSGFAPSDIEVGRGGELWVSIGGRGTRGAVYRIRAKEAGEYDGSAEWSPHFDLASRAPGGVPHPLRRNAPDAPPEDIALARDLLAAADPRAAFDACARPAAELLRAKPSLLRLRCLMRALGDWNLDKPSAEAFTGYELASARIFEAGKWQFLADCRAAARGALGAGGADLDREAARLLAMLRDDDPATPGRLLALIEAGSTPQDDVHYLLCLAKLSAPAAEGEAGRAAAALLGLAGKLGGAQLRAKQSWGERVGEGVAMLCQRVPGLPAALLAHPGFAKPDNAVFALALPAEARRDAARAFAAAVAEGGPGSASVVALLGSLPPPDAAPALRRLAADPALRDAAVPLLARAPSAADRPALALGLASAQERVAAAALGAIATLPEPGSRDESLAILAAARRFPKLADQALAALRRAAANDLPDLGAAAAWLGLPAESDPQDWEAALAAADWMAGDAAKGEAIFQSRACASCHAGDRAIGPPLAGVAGRFSAEDLIREIVFPGKAISPAYAATRFAMRDGSEVVGRVSFDSADGYIVQVGPAETVRLDSADIARVEPYHRSLMPEGLLAGLQATDLADLYAFLRTLR